MEDKELQQLKEAYRKSLPEKFEAIRQLIKKLRQNVAVETIKELRFYIHKMAGSAGIYGYPNVSDICRTWDQNLSEMITAFPACQKDSSWLDDFDRRFEKIKQEFSGHG